VEHCDDFENVMVQNHHKFNIKNTCIFEVDEYPDSFVTNDAVTIEEDTEVSHQALSWGLDRIDQERLPLDNSFNPGMYNGNGVNVYVLDTGIYTDHSDFAGRATLPKDFSGGGINDLHGHGTHCAGIVGSNTYGVARGANLIV